MEQSMKINKLLIQVRNSNGSKLKSWGTSKKEWKLWEEKSLSSIGTILRSPLFAYKDEISYRHLAYKSSIAARLCIFDNDIFEKKVRFWSNQISTGYYDKSLIIIIFAEVVETLGDRSGRPISVASPENIHFVHDTILKLSPCN